ncbi:HD domain-containing protein [Alkalihalobacillus sp. AL-G]|uniref:HD domain-containing protein n=1 Tax=Alkalihalobacillus sp. AL-G TaxID=2926399 RepID=UPI00272A87A4|nr:HD domain-containing protein [Alkalihalobacillus sp. AL-G]WLD93925.1 HD domain-containing protein [Alkalihalobacillus sp. AL-G]
MDLTRLQQQMSFLLEIDQLKNVLRQTYVSDRSRRENDAEHSWHLAMMALTLEEYANEKNINLLHVIKMLLIHDLVEIDAGDTFAYDNKGYEDKDEREREAADRIFNLLPENQAAHIFDLWEEFEARETPEARFAAALDRLQPMLLNSITKGASWQKHDIRKEQVLKRNAQIAEGSKDLWEYAQAVIEDSVEKGYLKV